jgi:hypothetical protein
MGGEDVAGLRDVVPWTSLAELEMTPGYTPAAPTDAVAALNAGSRSTDVVVAPHRRRDGDGAALHASSRVTYLLSSRLTGAMHDVMVVVLPCG